MAKKADTASDAPKPALVYGSWFGSDGLVFAPLDEAQRYADLRSGKGFPMTWGEFRTRFGDEACEDQIQASVDEADFASFENFLRDGVHDTEDESIYDWDAWHKSQRKSKQRSYKVKSYLEYCLALRTDPDNERTTRDLEAWMMWSVDRKLIEGVDLAAFEQAVRKHGDLLLNQLRQEYADLPVGYEGRAPIDTDDAQFIDDDGNIYDRPENITYWPSQAMLDWFPKDLAQRFGRAVNTVHDGEYLELQEESADEIVAALEALGYQCTLNDELLRIAAGY